MTAVEEIVRLIKDAGIARGKSGSLLPDQSLADQGFDSYDRMSLLSELEDHFSIELSDETAGQLRTINDIVNHLNSDDSASSSPP
jgi:acyl carrier protein